MTSVAAVGTSTFERVSSFLAREAELTDRHRFDEWLSLWLPEGIYWVPLNEDDYDPRAHLSIIYDNYERLQERCFRLSAEGVHSQDPRSRLCRTVGSVQLRATNPDGTIEVGSTMVLVEIRFGVKAVYAARLEWVLLDTADAFKIKSKKVILVDNDEPLGNVTFLL